MCLFLGVVQRSRANFDEFCTITISKNDKNPIFSVAPLALARKFLTFFSRTRAKTKQSWARAYDTILVFGKFTAFRVNSTAFMTDFDISKRQKPQKFLRSRLRRSRLISILPSLKYSFPAPTFWEYFHFFVILLLIFLLIFLPLCQGYTTWFCSSKLSFRSSRKTYLQYF